MSYNPYVKAGRQLDSILAYMAIHDLSDMVNRACDAKKGNALLSHLHKAVQEAKDFVTPYRFVDDENTSDSHSAKLFSEQVLLGIPVDADLRYPMAIEISDALNKIAGYQFVLALHGFFVGGGLTRGPFYCDETLAYGVGLVEAVGLWKSQHEFPRVVLSEQLRAWVLDYCRRYDQVFWPALERLLLVDEAGSMYVNYLVQADPQLEGTPDDNYLREHAQYLRKIAVRSDKEAKRVGWLIGYHNWFCSQYEGISGGSLTRSDLPLSADVFRPPLRLSKWYKKQQ